MAKPEKKRSIIAWAFYDWANSAFSTVVMMAFFPVFFKEYWSAGADTSISTLRLGAANSTASLVAAVLVPFLGAIADRGGTKKRFLMFFATMGIVMTVALYFVEQGAWPVAVFVYVTATIGFAAANSFYDSLLLTVAGERVDYVSARGYAYGYLGGGLLFLVNVVATLKPEIFGLRDSSHAIRVSFISVAIWWALFSIPIMIFVKEPRGERENFRNTVTSGFHQLKRTFAAVRNLRVLFLFLVGFWFYIDGVFTITSMAVDYGLSIGLGSRAMIVALLITQFVAFPAALLFGKLGERIGTKRGIYVAISVYIALCIGGALMQTEAHFYALAAVTGLVLGGIQLLSRSLYARLVPRNKTAEFFGFYNMVGRFSALLGPLMMGWVSVLTGNPRYSIISVVILFVIGLVFLTRVDEEAGRRVAHEMETV